MDFHWRHWTYSYWNKELVEQWLFVSDPVLLADPIDRIPAMPEQLASIARAEPAEASAVTKAFIQRILHELPAGTSFCGFCADYGPWSPDSSDPPHFFGMLWFTCLIAYGYPASEGSFHDRFTQVVGRHNFYQCLPKLWEDVAAWTRMRRQDGELVREIRLPPPSEHRPVIGYSHFLAFPNRNDRRALAKILEEAGLVGFEPPVTPVLQALSRARKALGKDFLDDFDDFQNRYALGQDPRNEAFWRAVRQEALDPSRGLSTNTGRRTSKTALVFLEDDQGLRPIVGCQSDVVLPEGFEVHQSDDLLNWPAYVTGSGGDLDASWREAFGEGLLLPISARKLIAQGLLVLREYSSGEYEVVSGPDIHGCQKAMVSRDFTKPFVDAFPGPAGRPTTIQPSMVDGWDEVAGCEIQQVDELPKELENFTQLLRTMSPPSVAFVGGIRTPSGFLFVPEFLPTLRAPGVGMLNVVFGDSEAVHPCVPDAKQPGDWRLPSAVDRPVGIRLRASWTMRTKGGSVDRTGDTRLQFVEHVVDDHYRGKPSGHYYVESCPQPEVDVALLTEVPLGISTRVAQQSSDLLELDASARFLGPGLGEMALERRPGFDWLVLGNKKNPELLVFAGDVENPSLPAARCSLSKGDQRHWRRGFHAKRTIARLPDGRFVSLAEAPPVIREAHARYKSHSVVNGLECPATGLETQTANVLVRAEPAAATSEAVDVIAALGSRRSGLAYADVREVFEALLGNDDPIQLQQILRGWTEAGLLDMLRSAHVSRFTLVPRTPRFVLVRRGPDVEATLVGLVTSVRLRHVKRALQNLDPACIHRLLPANAWQPATLRIRCVEGVVESVRREAELEASEWLDWPNHSEIPACLDIPTARTRIVRFPPPDSYRFDAGWDWVTGCFRRGHRSTEAVRLERRLHVDSSVIYVLTREDQPLLWANSRAWALLEAYAARGVPPFEVEHDVLTSTGRTPVHLPLPIGRLCVLIGEALPGPVLGSEPIRYTYPFGRRLFGLVERVLPTAWYERRVQSTRSIYARSDR